MPDVAHRPRDIAPPQKTYAFERSLGMTPAEACRRAGGNVDNGLATKWERNKRVQAWIAYYRSLDCTDEMLAAKRARIEQRLELASYGNIFEFASMVDRVILTPGEGEDSELQENIVRTPVIDWDKVANSPYGAIISGFKFDKDSGVLVDFERDNALQALMQLRDMHGFRAPRQTEIAGKGGGTIKLEETSNADRAIALAAFIARTKRVQKETAD